MDESDSSDDDHPKIKYISLGNGLYRVTGIRRSAITGRYITEPPKQS